ncbi:MAG TPA: fatty acid--CoA ligase family protein, partial [Azospirillaceae bacterium]|nr:fatty acid--CoA ligase family protein [Azospirillaceae bacterium]
ADFGDRLDPADLAAVRAILCTGAPLPPETVRRLGRVTAAPVYEYYGLTETCGACVLVRPEEAATAAGTLGRPAGVEAEVVDGNGRLLPDGAVGELRLKGPSLMRGYHRRPDLTAGMLRDGWLYTGDLVSRRADGCLVLHGRKRDIIKTPDGDILHLAEVERAFEADAAVVEAAVAACPDGEGRERAVAFLRLTPSREPSTERLAGLKRRVAAVLGAKRMPATLVPVDDFPRGGNGKVLKRVLVEEFLRPC